MSAAPGTVTSQQPLRVTSDTQQGLRSAPMTSAPETLRQLDSRRPVSLAADDSDDDIEDELDGDDLHDGEPTPVASGSAGVATGAPRRRHRSTFSKKDYRDMVSHLKSNWTAACKDCRLSFWAPLVRTVRTRLINQLRGTTLTTARITSLG